MKNKKGAKQQKFIQQVQKQVSNKFNPNAGRPNVLYEKISFFSDMNILEYIIFLTRLKGYRSKRRAPEKERRRTKKEGRTQSTF